MRAARIVATLAGRIRLDHFPAQGTMMVECISSLLDIFEEYSWRPERYERDTDVREEYERDWLLFEEEWYSSYDAEAIPRVKATDSKTQIQSYKGLVVQGLRILEKLAINEDNCRVIANNQGLLSKTMAPLISDQLHRNHDSEWSPSITVESLELMKRLMASLPGETETTRLRNEISSNSQAIIRILECHKCHMLLKRKAAQVLLHLSLVPPSMVVPSGSGSSSVRFIWMLLDIFLVPDSPIVDRTCSSPHLLKKSIDIARLAGEKITGASDTSMLPSVCYVIGSLGRTVAGAENKEYRIHAAMILKHLCRYYTKDDENLKELKKAMAIVMPEVLKEIVTVPQVPMTEEIQVAIEANNGGNKVLVTEDLDLEQGAVPHHNEGQESSSTAPHQPKGEQHLGIQQREALLDLCWAIIYTWIDASVQRGNTCERSTR